MKVLSLVLDLFLRFLFIRVVKKPFQKEEIEEFEQIYNEALLSKDQLITYSSSYPKTRFIRYVAEMKGYLLHGSNDRSITLFEPRKQTLFNNTMVEAVFATSDEFWSLFYAVLDKSKIIGSIRNACLSIENKSNKKYYFFSVDNRMPTLNPWLEGMIYFLPQDSFRKVSSGPIAFDEWISESHVAPSLKINVHPSDFTFLPNVTSHKNKESIYASWFSYKLRLFMEKRR